MRFRVAAGFLVMAIAIIVLQARRILLLESQIEQMSSRGEVAIGTLVPEMRAKDMAGRPATIRFSDSAQPTMVYVFSPSCGYCMRNADALNSLVGNVSGKYRIIGVSLATDGVSQFASDHRMNFPIYTAPESGTMTSLHLGLTPETIVISREGKVLGDWRGAYVGTTATLVENFFGVRLNQTSQ